MTLPSNYSIFQNQFLSRQISILEPKEALCLPSNSTAYSALELLSKNKVGAVCLTSKGGDLEGIFSERDAILKIATQSLDPKSVLLSEVATKSPQTLKSNASVARAIYTMATGNFRHVPIVTAGSKEIRMISVKDIVDHLYKRLTKRIVVADSEQIIDENAVDKFFASNISILCPHKPVSVSGTDSIADCLRKIAANDVGSVAILGDNHTIAGIFTERDYITKLATQGPEALKAPISSVMTQKPFTAQQTMSVAYVFNLMSEGGYRHIPVVNERESLIGLLSVKNFVTYLSNSILEELEN